MAHEDPNSAEPTVDPHSTGEPVVVEVDLVRNVLVAYDGFEHDDPICAEAVALARSTRAHLHLVHVVPEVRGVLFNVDSGELQTALVETRLRKLESLAEPLRESGLEVHTSVRIGVPHVELIRASKATGASVLVLTDEPSRRGDSRGFGAITMKLLRQSKCPVWAVRLHQPVRHRHILAAVDVGPDNAHENGPNAAIMAFAAAIARRDSARLYVMHAWSVFGEALLRNRLTERDLERTFEAAEQTQRAYVESLVVSSTLDGIDVEVVLEHGEPRRIIPAAVAELEIDLVVMGSVSRTGLAGLLVGNSAEKILNRLTCSVLTVKPDGFAALVQD